PSGTVKPVFPEFTRRQNSPVRSQLRHDSPQFGSYGGSSSDSGDAAISVSNASPKSCLVDLLRPCHDRPELKAEREHASSTLREGSPVLYGCD
ncbi:MAG: hypothetical protein ACK50J_31285, partial [Planctomyces sp.]